MTLTEETFSPRPCSQMFWVGALSRTRMLVSPLKVSDCGSIRRLRE